MIGLITNIRGYLNNKKSILFSLFIVPFAIAKSWGLTAGDGAYKAFALVGILFWILTICGENYRLSEVVICGLVLLCSLLSLMYSEKIGVIFPAMVVIAAKEIDVDKQICVMVKVWTLTFLFKLFLVLVGLIPNEIKYKSTELAKGQGAYKIGYIDPNSAYLTFTVAVLGIVYIMWDKIKWWWYLIIVGLATIMFYLTLSYTGFGIILITAIIGLLYLLFDKIDKIKIRELSIRLLGIMTAIPMIITLVILIITGKSEGLDRLLFTITSHRSEISYDMMGAYPTTLFGQRFSGLLSYEIIDNAYVYTWLGLGTVIFSIYFVLYFKCIRRQIKNNSMARIVIILCFLIYGFMEQFVINPFMNFTWFFVAETFWCTLEKKEVHS